MVNKVEYI